MFIFVDFCWSSSWSAVQQKRNDAPTHMTKCVKVHAQRPFSFFSPINLTFNDFMWKQQSKQYSNMEQYSFNFSILAVKKRRFIVSHSEHNFCFYVLLLHSNLSSGREMKFHVLCGNPLRKYWCLSDYRHILSSVKAGTAGKKTEPSTTKMSKQTVVANKRIC